MSPDPQASRFAPRNWPFFYGWMILVAGTIGMITSGPGQTAGVAPFTESLISTLGITRVQLSMAYMFGTIGSAFLLTRAGKLYDRYGARIVATASGITLGLSLVALSQCDRLATAIGAWFPFFDSATSALIVATLCFFMLRFSGQGVMSMVSVNMMMKWFDRHRGLVTGITGMVVAPAFAALPLVLNLLVEAVSWRQAWLILAGVAGIGFSVFAWIFYRDNPEACGLKPDGPLGERSLGSKRPRHHPHVQFTLQQARRMPAFWIFALGIGLLGCIMTGFTFHVASIFENAGYRAAQGFAIFLPCAIVSVCLRPLVGWLADRIPLKFLLIVVLVGVMAISVAITMLGSRWALVLLIAGYGLCGAIFGTLNSATWPNFFGRSHLGAISGFASSITVSSSAIGPWLYGQSLAFTNSYTPISIAGLICAAILMVFATRADDPQTAAEVDRPGNSPIP